VQDQGKAEMLLGTGKTEAVNKLRRGKALSQGLHHCV